MFLLVSPYATEFANRMAVRFIYSRLFRGFLRPLLAVFFLRETGRLERLFLPSRLGSTAVPSTFLRKFFCAASLAGRDRVFPSTEITTGLTGLSPSSPFV